MDSAVDVAEYTDAVVILTITQFQKQGMAEPQADPFRIYLQTSLENYDERYVRLKQLASIDDDIATQQAWHFTFTGPGQTSSEDPSSDCPGFGRFLRVEVVTGVWQEAAPQLVFDVKAMLRAR